MARIRANEGTTDLAAPHESPGPPSAVGAGPTKRTTDVASGLAGTGPHGAGESEAARISYAWRALLVVGLSSVVVALNQSTLNVALPAVVRHFDAGPLASSWVLLGFMLANTVFLVMFGRMSDMFGRRGMFLGGVAAFTLSSLLLGLAPNIWVLIVLRLVHGASSALLLANSGAIIGDAFPKRLLSRGMGLYIASFSVAQLVGPTVGGILADGLGWQWVFWINVPVGMLCFGLGAVILRKVPRGPREGLDVSGNALFLVALSSLVIALSEVGTLGWGHPLVFGGLIAFVVLLSAFLAVERRAKSPVLDPTMFRNPSFSTAIVASMLNTMSRNAVLLLVALYFQAVTRDSALEAGLKVIPLPIGTLLGSAMLGLLTRRIGPRPIATIGSSILASGLVLLVTQVSVDQDYPLVAVALALVGFGGGLFLAANSTAIMEMSPSNRLGVANAIRLMIQNVGIVTSTALTLTIAASHLPVSLRDQVFGGSVETVSQRSLDGLLTGHREALMLLLGIAILGILACAASQYAASRERRRAAPDDAVLDSQRGR